jgi:hypothetical protein
MDRKINRAAGARKQGRRGGRSSDANEDPTRTFFERHLGDYAAHEKHLYATRGRALGQHYSAEEFRGDTSSDEAFNPLNIGLRRG